MLSLVLNRKVIPCLQLTFSLELDTSMSFCKDLRKPINLEVDWDRFLCTEKPDILH